MVILAKKFLGKYRKSIALLQTELYKQKLCWNLINDNTWKVQLVQANQTLANPAEI